MATEYSFELNVSKDKKTATLTVVLPKRDKARDPILEFGDKAAMALLNEQGVRNMSLDITQPRLTNWNNAALNGSWSFAVAEATTTTTTATAATVEATGVTGGTTATITAETKTVTPVQGNTRTKSKRRRNKVTTTNESS
jgi:hypothetical protein